MTGWFRFDRQTVDELVAVLPRRSDRTPTFIIRAEVDVQMHRYGLLRGGPSAGDLCDHQLEKLARAAADLADVIERCDDETKLLLRAEVAVRAREKARRVSDVSGFLDQQMRQVMTGTAGVARTLADLAAAARVGMRSRPKRRHEDLAGIVGSLAMAYARCFEVKPSAASQGHFARAMRIIIDAACIDTGSARLGQGWLQAVIDDHTSILRHTRTRSGRYPGPTRSRKRQRLTS